MFTSEPSLAQRIERMIDATPIVDVYSRIDPRRPSAPDLSSLLADPLLLPLLRSVGYRGEMTASKRSESERITEVLPHLRMVRNTAAGWCFYRILRDLYDFTDPEITTENLYPLAERVAQAAADPAWPAFVLQKRARLAQIVTGHAGSDPQIAASPLIESGLIRCRLDLETLDPGDADAETIRRSVFEQLDEQIEAPIVCAALSDGMDQTNLVAAAVLQWHHLHEALLLVRASGKADPFEAAEVLSRYRSARLCLLTTLDDSTDGLDGLVLGRHDSGWTVASRLGLRLAPARLEARTLERIERLPAGKILNFASDAETAEWTYGAYVLARRATAAALSRAVVGGYFEEDEIPPLCRAIFHDSPRRWLRLGD